MAEELVVSKLSLVDGQGRTRAVLRTVGDDVEFFITNSNGTGVFIISQNNAIGDSTLTLKSGTSNFPNIIIQAQNDKTVIVVRDAGGNVIFNSDRF